MSQYFPGQPGPPPGDLSYLIQGTRGQVSTYLIKARARQRRLLTLAVVAGALATLFAGDQLLVDRHCQTRWPHVRTFITGLAAVVYLCRTLLAGCGHRHPVVEIPKS